jgi:hypothetical protein
VFGQERVVFFRETAVGQSLLSYWAAKALETLLWLPIFTCAFVVLGYSSDAWLIQPLNTYWGFLFLAMAGFSGFGTSSGAQTFTNFWFIFWSTQGKSVAE